MWGKEREWGEKKRKVSRRWVSMVREWVKESREWFWGQGVGWEKGESVERGRWARVSMRENVGVRDKIEKSGVKEWDERDREKGRVFERESGC